MSDSGTRRISDMELGSSYGAMVQFMKVNGLMIVRTDMEDSYTQMGMFTKANG